MTPKMTLDIGEKVGNKAVPSTLKTFDLVGFGFETRNRGTSAGIGMGSARGDSGYSPKLYVATKKGDDVYDLLFLMQTGKLVPRAVVRSFISGKEQLSIEMERVLLPTGFMFPKGGWKFVLDYEKVTFNYSPGVVQVVDKFSIEPHTAE